MPHPRIDCQGGGRRLKRSEIEEKEKRRYRQHCTTCADEAEDRPDHDADDECFDDDQDGDPFSESKTDGWVPVEPQSV